MKKLTTLTTLIALAAALSAPAWAATKTVTLSLDAVGSIVSRYDRWIVHVVARQEAEQFANHEEAMFIVIRCEVSNA